MRLMTNKDDRERACWCKSLFPHSFFFVIRNKQLTLLVDTGVSQKVLTDYSLCFQEIA